MMIITIMICNRLLSWERYLRGLRIISVIIRKEFLFFIHFFFIFTVIIYWMRLYIIIMRPINLNIGLLYMVNRRFSFTLLFLFLFSCHVIILRVMRGSSVILLPRW